MGVASNSHSECVKLLIDNHCDVNAENSNGDTSLILAAKTDRIECVKLLIDNHF
jgi:ankyrin repeat protein